MNTSLHHEPFSFRFYAVWLYRCLIEPRSSDEENHRQEFILNIILVGSIAFLSIFEGIVMAEWLRWIWYGIPYTGISIYLFSFIYLVYIFLLYLSRKGYHRPVSFSLIVLYFVGTTYGAILWGPDLYQIVLTYGLIIVMTSILIGTTWSFLIIGIVAATITTVTYLNTRGLLNFNRDWTHEGLGINDAVELSLTYLLITVISWLSNREIKKSLKRAHTSEKELQRKNDSLETIVEERTRELRRAQAEKVAELYRFSEFGRLSMGVFHDLVNPLSIVASNIEHLPITADPDMPNIKEYVSRAVTASKRMEHFISTVKKQIRIEEFETYFCLNEVIEEVFILLHYNALKAGVTLHFKAFKKVKTYGNPLKFQQIVTNLLVNAIDSYEESQRPSDEKTVSLRLKKNKGLIYIVASDHGSGIKEEILPKIFESFFTTKPDQKGLGLGLSTLKDIVEKDFQGKITVRSKVGLGSTFIITFLQKKHESQNPGKGGVERSDPQLSVQKPKS